MVWIWGEWLGGYGLGGFLEGGSCWDRDLRFLK